MIKDDTKKEKLYTREATRKRKKSFFSKLIHFIPRRAPASKPVYTKKAPEPVGPYSQAMQIYQKTYQTHQWLFLSGQIPLDSETSKIVGESISDQTDQVFKNIKAILETQKMDFYHVVKTLVFLTDMDDFETFNRVYETHFKEHQPARSCVEVSKLPKGVKVEVEVIACQTRFF